MKQLKLFILLLLINFGSLAIGVWLMESGPRTQWYLSLNKAPWTPPGWLFGVAWSLIMFCFSVYLSKLFVIRNSRETKMLFGAQVILNILWNYLFFNQHLVSYGLINLVLLTLVIFYFFFRYKGSVKTYRYLLLPYMIWSVLACSLNAYVVFNN